MFRSKAKRLLLQKSLNEGRNISQREVATQTGLEEATVSLWMNAKLMGSVRAETVKVLCEYFGCTLDELLEITELTTPPKSKNPLLPALHA
jgi:transcriptional regulator with XRE-family HTH domain